MSIGGMLVALTAEAFLKARSLSRNSNISMTVSMFALFLSLSKSLCRSLLMKHLALSYLKMYKQLFFTTAIRKVLCSSVKSGSAGYATTGAIKRSI